MTMSSSQNTAFEAAVGHSPTVTSTSMALMIAVVFLLWAAWVVLFRMQQWKKGSCDLNDLVWSSVRVAGLLLLIFMFIR